ncbi:MAG: ABC transporter substrate-binding protein [Spirochaetales bacterium]|nr:ABC transporter substrate-binding protein [Spirochaetales bacterium]
MKRFLSISVAAAVVLAALSFASCSKPAVPQAPTLKIAYSDWPGWVAWDVTQAKGFFKKEGVNVQLIWFGYGPSMDAFSAGKVDAVCVTNGDALVTSASGAKNVEILLNDYSNGNDMIIAKPGINSVKDLKGKKIGVEVGLVDHLLLLKALQMNGLSAKDVTLVNMHTDQAAQILASSGVDAVAAWQPNAGQALQAVPGSKAIFTSADAPGLIYDTLAVNPESLAKYPDAWKKVVKAWYETVDYIDDPAHKAEVVGIMSARDNLPPAQYAAFMDGTHLLTLNEALKAFTPGPGLDSLYGSSAIVDQFNVENKVYNTPQDIQANIDPQLIESLK